MIWLIMSSVIASHTSLELENNDAAGLLKVAADSKLERRKMIVYSVFSSLPKKT
jgi:hypothetical protein